MAKIIVSCTENPMTEEKRAAITKRVADALGVLPDDVVLLPAGLSVAVVETPADLVKAREKQDAHDKHEAEKKAKEEQHAAELKAKEEAEAEKKAAHKKS